MGHGGGGGGGGLGTIVYMYIIMSPESDKWALPTELLFIIIIHTLHS